MWAIISEITVGLKRAAAPLPLNHGGTPPSLYSGRSGFTQPARICNAGWGLRLRKDPGWGPWALLVGKGQTGKIAGQECPAVLPAGARAT